jgi:accessory colonization factor AcfC
MTKTQINKAAAKMVADIVWNAPETTIMSLLTQADEAFGTDKCKVLDAAIALIEAKEDACKKAHIKLINDLNALGLQRLEDGNIASENLSNKIVEGTVTFWATYYNACCQVVMVHAGDEGIDINDKLCYAIY